MRSQEALRRICRAKKMTLKSIDGRVCCVNFIAQRSPEEDRIWLNELIHPAPVSTFVSSSWKGKATTLPTTWFAESAVSTFPLLTRHPHLKTPPWDPRIRTIANACRQWSGLRAVSSHCLCYSMLTPSFRQLVRSSCLLAAWAARISSFSNL